VTTRRLFVLPFAQSMDPYSDAYTQPSHPAEPVKEKDPSPRRSRSRSPTRSPSFRHSPPRHKRSGQIAPNPSSVLGVFGLSIRSTERDLDDEFSRYGRVEKVIIVYDQLVGWLRVRLPIVSHVSARLDVLVVLASSPCPLWMKLLAASKN